jgi:hypothetical protein
MKDNVINFPKKETEVISVDEDDVILYQSLSVAHEILEQLHDVLHEQTDECIFTDPEYSNMITLFIETVSAMYHMTQGKTHVLQEIADDFFEEMVDNTDEKDYNDNNETDKE